ncbi:uncharacterized protein LOC143851776 [Tasmannia lanceolata]|uniref:uncharacterized protein LOC143851776 n=1 Tax=Tasmannia lanceolata TaxID=3420 RepID=UPI00406352EC
MGEEQQLSSEGDSSSKRKLEEIEFAKLKAQEIVARLVNDAETKRPRFEDLSEAPPTFDFAQKPSSQPIANAQAGSVPFASQPGPYYSFHGTTKRMDIPNGKVGVIIGKGGETIKYLQLQSGAKIQITKDMDADPYSQTREVELTGTTEQITRAEQLIKDVISETDTRGSGSTAARGFTPMQHGTEQFSMKVPNNKVALIIGKGGETIKNMQSRSGARIQIIPLHLPPGDTSTERTIYMNGTMEQIESAKELINEIISENRVRNPSMSANYIQQAYRPPGNWAPPGPSLMQQSGYDYTQPGVYPTPPPYYSGFPQPTGWDQTPTSTAPPPPQQTVGYDYYTQQPQTGSATANANYGYTQTVPDTNYIYDQSYPHQQQNYGQDALAQGQEHDQQKPSLTVDGTTTSQPYSAPPSHLYEYIQQPNVPPIGYTSSQTYSGLLPPQPGYDQMGVSQTGYAGPQQPHIPPPTSQLGYGQGGYPYTQGVKPIAYGHPQPQPTSTVYSQSAYTSERTVASAPATQETTHPQS